MTSFPLDEVRAEGYGFQVEMTYRVDAAGGSITEVPIEFRDRELGTSKMSGRIVAEAFILVAWWALRDRVLRRGLRWWNGRGSCCSSSTSGAAGAPTGARPGE